MDLPPLHNLVRVFLFTLLSCITFLLMR